MSGILSGGRTDNSPRFHAKQPHPCRHAGSACLHLYATRHSFRQDDYFKVDYWWSSAGKLGRKLSAAPQNKVIIVSRVTPVETRIQNTCLDTGLRRYDETRLDTYLRWAVLNTFHEKI